METATTVVSAQALITDLFGIIDNRRWGELGRVLTTDCVCCPAGSPPLVGLASIEHYYRNERPIVAGRHRVDVIVSDLGAAACWGVFTGDTKAGEHLEVSLAEAFLVRDGKIAWRATYLRHASVPQAASPPARATAEASPR